MIKFTVITVTYNAADVFKCTADSVLMQKYPYVELLIIDGASTCLLYTSPSPRDS